MFNFNKVLINMKTINVVKDFGTFPSGRKKFDSKHSGEEFAERFLIPYLENKEPVTIELDGVIGYSSAFLHEAFGSAVHKANVSYEEFHSLIKLHTSDDILLMEIDLYIKEFCKK